MKENAIKFLQWISAGILLEQLELCNDNDHFWWEYNGKEISVDQLYEMFQDRPKKKTRKQLDNLIEIIKNG